MRKPDTYKGPLVPKKCYSNDQEHCQIFVINHVNQMSNQFDEGITRR